MNNQNVLPEIIKLIEDKMGKYKEPLSRETKLEKDLGMSGDDAFEFIDVFCRLYKVDLTKFSINKYFNGERDGLLDGLLGLVLKKKNSSTQKDLTIGDLEKAVIEGRLDDALMEKSSDAQ